MKALILAGGRGSRLGDRSASLNKCLIDVGGRPVIEYSLDAAVETDVDEMVIVVGYVAEAIINRYGNCYRGKKVTYVIQWERKGLVHAIECAKEALGGLDFMLLLGDEVMVRPCHQAMLENFIAGDAFVLCGVLPVDNRELIRRTYTLIQDSRGVVSRLVEKPRNPFSNLMGTGDCVFRNDILRYIDVTPIHHERQEKELPDLIQCAIDDGKIVRSFHICDHYANINSHEDILRAERLLGVRQ